MKTLIVLAVVAILSSAGPIWAQAPAQAPADKAAAKKPPVRSVSGTVKSTSADTVVVGGRDKGKDTEWTFAVEPTTDIRKGTKSITAGDLKAGEGVNVRFVEQDGKALARSIIVRGKSAPAAKAVKP